MLTSREVCAIAADALLDAPLDLILTALAHEALDARASVGFIGSGPSSLPRNGAPVVVLGVAPGMVRPVIGDALAAEWPL